MPVPSEVDLMSSVCSARRVAIGVLLLSALAGGSLVVRSGWRLRDLGGSLRPDGMAAADVKCGQVVEDEG